MKIQSKATTSVTMAGRKQIYNEINYIEINQPIGSFYLGKANSDDLLEYFFVNRREQNVGIQRDTSQKRIEEISLYCQDPDATFPTPIIIAVDSSEVNIDLRIIQFRLRAQIKFLRSLMVNIEWKELNQLRSVLVLVVSQS